MKQYVRSFSVPLCIGKLFLLANALLSFPACEQNPVFSEPIVPPVLTPREAYMAALDSSGLADTKMARTWQLAGSQVFTDSILIDAPFQETTYFRAEIPEALAYRLELTTGELLRIDLFSEPDSILFFIDLFQVAATDSTVNFREVFHAENYRTDSLAYEVPQTGRYLLRIQPELLAGCRANLRLIVQPVYGVFPVSGKGNRDIWSFFGDPRDGGQRKHKGVDIFARRGTPVVAAVDGVVRRVRNRGLGGKQVWLSDTERRQSLYYAHLDSQLVREGQLVQAGDTLGLVGNTGNARNTRPHLHFSIYRRGYGAIDPHPFVASQKEDPPTVRSDTSRLGQLARVRRRNTRLLAAPESRSMALASLNRHLPVQVLAASKNWYRVRSPDGLSGYLPAGNLEDVSQAIKRITLEAFTELQRAPAPSSVRLAALAPETEITVIGTHENYQLVRDDAGTIGWMPVR